MLCRLVEETRRVEVRDRAGGENRQEAQKVIGFRWFPGSNIGVVRGDVNEGLEIIEVVEVVRKRKTRKVSKSRLTRLAGFALYI